jgi:hypothetical protein
LQISHSTTNDHCAPQPVTAVPLAPIDPMLTKFQVSELLDESFEVLEKWRKRPGTGPKFVRYPNGDIRYRLSAVMKFLEEHTVRP